MSEHTTPETDEIDTTETLVPEEPETPAAGDLEATTDEPAGDPEEAETFPREYVEKLRQENGHYRQRAQRADDLARRLHHALVRTDGRLADPTDLDFSDDHLDDDGEALSTAITDLLARKPHLAARRPVGDIGQGATTTSADVDLLGILRG